jgi:hypothetical protein
MGQRIVEWKLAESLHQLSEGKEGVNGDFNFEKIPEDLHHDVKGSQD